MRIGFITQLLWNRYGSFWVSTLKSIGVNCYFPSPESVAEHLGDPRLKEIPGQMFRLAAAQALSMQDVDMIIVPRLNMSGEIYKGSGQDPWITSFPEALMAQFRHLPPMLSIPASLENELEKVVVETLLSLSHDPVRVRRAWERNKGMAKPIKYHEPYWDREGKEGIGLIGQPWLPFNLLVDKDEDEHKHYISSHQFKPSMLRQEGLRLKENLADTDLEVLGAARYLGRRGGIARLRFVRDPTSGADVWLSKYLPRLVHKPLEIVDFPGELNIVETLVRGP